MIKFPKSSTLNAFFKTLSISYSTFQFDFEGISLKVGENEHEVDSRSDHSMDLSLSLTESNAWLAFKKNDSLIVNVTRDFSIPALELLFTSRSTDRHKPN